MRDLISPADYPRAWMKTSRLFYMAPYSLCGDRVDFLMKQVNRAQFIVTIDENRAVQYRSAPTRFPVLSAFYRHLYQENLGYRTVWVSDDGVWPPSPIGGHGDHSFTGYDNPRVRIFRRDEETAVLDGFEKLRTETVESDHCPDRAMHAMVSTLRSGELGHSVAALEQLATDHPMSLLPVRLQAYVYRQAGQDAKANTILASFLPANASGPLKYVSSMGMRHFAGPFAASAFIGIGLSDLGTRVLQELLGGGT